MAPKVDPETGEMMDENLPTKHYDSAELALRTAPDWRKVKPIEEVVGKAPPLFNLKDHPDFSGRSFTIVRVREAEGDFGFHLYLAGFLAKSAKPDDKPEACIIRTGSEFVLGRVVPAIPVINGGQPLFGTLRNAGRSWFFE